MQPNINGNEDKIQYAEFLFQKCYLPGPIKCSYGGQIFNINKDRVEKIANVLFVA